MDNNVLLGHIPGQGSLSSLHHRFIEDSQNNLYVPVHCIGSRNIGIQPMLSRLGLLQKAVFTRPHYNKPVDQTQLIPNILDGAQTEARNAMLILENNIGEWHRLVNPVFLDDTVGYTNLYVSRDVMRWGTPAGGGILTGDAGVGKSRIILTLAMDRANDTLIVAKNQDRVKEWYDHARDLGVEITCITSKKLCAAHRKSTEANDAITKKLWSRVVLDDCTYLPTAKVVSYFMKLITCNRWVVGQDSNFSIATADKIVYFAGPNRTERYLQVSARYLAGCQIQHVPCWNHTQRSRAVALAGLNPGERRRFEGGHPVTTSAIIPVPEEEGCEQCIICYDSPATTLINECDHRPNMCEECAMNWARQVAARGARNVTCPMCRKGGFFVHHHSRAVENVTVGARKAEAISTLLTIYPESNVYVYSDQPDFAETAKRWNIPAGCLTRPEQPSGTSQAQFIVVLYDSLTGTGHGCTTAHQEIGRIRRTLGPSHQLLTISLWVLKQ